MTDNQQNEQNENPFDMLNIRDFCGTSRNIIQDYFYYNNYSQETFGYKLTFKENPLLDIIDGKGKILDYILTLIPFIILFIFGIVYIFCCTAFWMCICCPIDCCKKNKTICNKKILLILFHIFSLIIIIFSIFGIIFINFSKQDLHGMICSLNLFVYNIIYGQGAIKKTEFKKPMWQSLEILKKIANEGQLLFTNTIGNCTNFKNKYIDSNIETTNNKCENFISKYQTLDLNDIDVELLSNSKYCSIIYDNDVLNLYKTSLSNIIPNNKIIIYKNVTDDKDINILPLYINRLGDIEDQNTNTFLGKINNEFNNNYMYSFDKFFGIVYKNCMIMRDELSAYSDALSDVGDFTDELKDSLNDISEKIVNKLSDYVKKYENYLFSTYIAFFSLIIIFIFLLNIVFLLYLKSYYNISRKFIIIFWVITNIIIIILFLLSSLLGILSYVFNDVGDVIDFIFSPENLKSAEPRLLPGGRMDKIITCLNPQGNLFDTFTSSDDSDKIIIAVNLFNELYNLKYLIMNESYLYSDYSIQKTSKNHLNSISNIKENLNEYRNDFSLTTNNYSTINIQDEIDELNQYSYSAKYQEKCGKFSPIYWTSKDCPTSTEGQCKLISTFSNNFYSPANTCNFEQNSGYNNAFDYPYEIENKYLGNLKTYNDKNIEKIENLEAKFKELFSKYKDTIALNMHDALEDSLAIVDLVFNVFHNYIDNDPIENPENYENPKVDIFSFLNCSSIGRDLNVTIYVIKEKLSKDFLSVSILNYVMNFISIFVIILVVFLLNLYKYDENEEINKNNENEKKNLINNEGTPDIENNEKIENNDLKYIKTTTITGEKLNQSEKEKTENSNSDLNSKTDDENKKSNNFLMNRKDNNDLNNSISNPMNLEINKKNDELEQISEEGKNNEYKNENISDF